MLYRNVIDDLNRSADYRVKIKVNLSVLFLCVDGGAKSFNALQWLRKESGEAYIKVGR